MIIEGLVTLVWASPFLSEIPTVGISDSRNFRQKNVYNIEHRWQFWNLSLCHASSKGYIPFTRNFNKPIPQCWESNPGQQGQKSTNDTSVLCPLTLLDCCLHKVVARDDLNSGHSNIEVIYLPPILIYITTNLCEWAVYSPCHLGLSIPA